MREDGGAQGRSRWRRRSRKEGNMENTVIPLFLSVQQQTDHESIKAQNGFFQSV